MPPVFTMAAAALLPLGILALYQSRINGDFVYTYNRDFVYTYNSSLH